MRLQTSRPKRLWHQQNLMRLRTNHLLNPRHLQTSQ
jgi:hypothetical protein